MTLGQRGVVAQPAFAKASAFVETMADKTAGRSRRQRIAQLRKSLISTITADIRRYFLQNVPTPAAAANACAAARVCPRRANPVGLNWGKLDDKE